MKTSPAVALLFLLSLPAYSQQVLSLTFAADEAAADPAAGTIPLRLTLTNLADAVVPGIELTLNSNFGGVAGVVLSEPQWSCTGTSNFLRCIGPSLSPKASLTIDALMRFPDRAGRALLSANATYNGPGSGRLHGDHEAATAALFRRFVVTRTDDAGEGTLRGAIQALNAEPVCATLPCRIEFAVPPPPANDWITIQPLTAYPAIVAGDVEIDGTTQADTNPLGPDVALIGTTLGSGNGLDLRTAPQSRLSRMVVRGLAIAGFPDSGIFYLPSRRDNNGFTIERNYIGTDATGSHAIANGARGITIGEGMVTESFIRDNVISGNFRSGIFIVTETESFLTAPLIRIQRNRIGLAAASDAPIANGASGIFVGPRATEVLIENNVIAHNAHFGIAVAHGATYTRVGSGNRIYGHPLSAIDVGLDGPTPPGAVRIASARYDAATNTTTVEVEGPGSILGKQWYEYTFYASDGIDAAGYAEGEQFLGTAASGIESGHATFRFTGDLRGRYVTAVPTWVWWAEAAPLFTSEEFLRPVRVE